MGIASMVIGIIALIISIIPFIGSAAIFLAIPAGLLAIAQIAWPKKKKGMAIAGLVLAGIAGTISYAQFELVKDTASEIDAGLKEIEANTGYVFDRNAEPSNPPPTKKTTAKTKLPAITIDSAYIYADNFCIFGANFTNNTDKTIEAFTGYFVFYDDFGKVKKRIKIPLTYRVELPPKTQKFAVYSEGGLRPSIMFFDDFDAYKKSDFGKYGTLMKTVKFDPIDIKYAD